MPLKAACRQRRPTRPVIFHSDRGCRYNSRQFAAPADEFGVRLSVGCTGQYRDNALAESFFATIKRELLGIAAWPSRAAARTAISDFIASRYNCIVCTALMFAAPLFAGFTNWILPLQTGAPDVAFPRWNALAGVPCCVLLSNTSRALR
ncbi:integrase core domain-containing protein [Streptomyces sp. NPDC005407]|uniref:integrase core domain-containing protein n=1 Tax=Streptomyces sp. NPDC005407 TaxID=3155340 RepID=UPI0033AC63BE